MTDIVDKACPLA